MQFRELKSLEDLKIAFPLMSQLRESLGEDEFIYLVQTAKKESGYCLIGCYQDQFLIGLLGFRILTDLVHGRHFYIDDLVVDVNQRSQGIGEQILKYCEKLADENSCKKLRLCTGIQNEKGKSFYQKCGWSLKAVAYKKYL